MNSIDIARIATWNIHSKLPGGWKKTLARAKIEKVLEFFDAFIRMPLKRASLDINSNLMKRFKVNYD